MKVFKKKSSRLIVLAGIFILFFPVIVPVDIIAQSSVEVERFIDEGIRYERENRLDEATRAYRKALELDPSNILIMVRLAKVLSWQNRFDEALDILNSVLEQAPRQSEALFRKAQILSWQGKYSESIETYGRYLEIKGDDTDALMGIARVYFWSGKNEEAIEYFNKAIEAGADEIEARIELGKVYLAMNDTYMAKEEFNRVLQLDPENNEAKRYLKSIPALISFEIIPVAFSWDLYPDRSLGITASSSVTYHHKQAWNIFFLYKDAAIGSVHDNTVTVKNVLMGIPNLYMMGSFFYTPDPDFSPVTGGEIGASLSFGGGFGAGLYLSADYYGEAPRLTIQNDTLVAIKPEIIKYFGELNFILLRYNQYFYTSGYSTATFNLSTNFAYFQNNCIYAGLTYGGDIETRKKERRVFEIALGISFNVTENLGLFFNYNWVETQFGKTNQFEFHPLIKW
ncbi:MAG: tetratricopeptide repeat protein [Spirochaetota bacterium]